MESLPKTVRGINASGIGLTKLVRKIRIVVHHSALPLKHLTTVLLLLIPPLKQRRGAVHCHRAERGLGATGRFCRPVLRMDVLRVHLRRSRNTASQCDNGQSRGTECHGTARHSAKLAHFCCAIEGGAPSARLLFGRSTSSRTLTVNEAHGMAFAVDLGRTAAGMHAAGSTHEGIRLSLGEIGGYG